MLPIPRLAWTSRPSTWVDAAPIVDARCSQVVQVTGLLMVQWPDHMNGTRMLTLMVGLTCRASRELPRAPLPEWRRPTGDHREFHGR